MADGLPSPEEFEKWLLPPDALALVEKTYGAPGARVAIMERLHAKIIDAISPSTSFTKGDTEPTHTKELIPVPARYWKYIHDESTFWQNGDAMFFTSDPRTSEAYITRCFGIKLDPADVGTIPHRPVAERLDQKAAPAEHATLASESDGRAAKLAPVKGPPVSREHLRLWHELYRLVYRGPEDTEPNAIKSAEGMFHGRHVVRDRIRELRGPQKSGRPSKKKG